MMEVYGKLVDNKGRCEHYNSEVDTVNIKFKCCQKFYACIYCHSEYEEHDASIWLRSEFDQKVIHCGSCGHLMSIHDYLENKSCLSCNKPFNPNCEKHFKYYFEI